MPTIKNLRDEAAKLKKINPQRSYLWTAVLPNLGVNTNYGILDTGENPIYASPSVDLINPRIAAVSLPFNQFEIVKKPMGNSFVYSTNGNDIGNIVMDIYEFEDGLTMKYLQQWEKLMTVGYNSLTTLQAHQNPAVFKIPVSTVQVPATYKRSISFYWWDTNKNVVAKFTYYGYFLSGIADSTNEYEANAIVKYTATFTGDSMSYEIIRDPNEIAAAVKTLSEFKVGERDPFNGAGNLIQNIFER